MLSINKRIASTNIYELENGTLICQSGWDDEVFYDENFNVYRPVYKNQELVGFKMRDGIL